MSARAEARLVFHDEAPQQRQVLEKSAGGRKGLTKPSSEMSITLNSWRLTFGTCANSKERVCRCTEQTTKQRLARSQQPNLGFHMLLPSHPASTRLLRTVQPPMTQTAAACAKQ